MKRNTGDKVSNNKKYFWLKLKEDFFNQKEIKVLRRLAGGDTFTIIYLKILLLSLKTNGKIYYDGIASSMIEEIAIEIDENIENTQITFNFLLQKNLIEFSDDDEVKIANMASLVGSETESARRMRKHRASNASHCDIDVTDMLHLSDTEIEIDIEIDKDNIYSASGDTQNNSSTQKNSSTKQYKVFEKIWSMYPEKKGKGQVSKKSKEQIEKLGIEKMEKALQRYIDDVEKQRKQGFSSLRYKNGSTWFNSGYEDYLVEENNITEAKKEPAKIVYVNRGYL